MRLVMPLDLHYTPSNTFYLMFSIFRNIDQCYNIKSEDGTSMIVIESMEFNLEDATQTSCPYDYLSIYDGTLFQVVF